MKIFNFVARNISYTFAISFITVLFGWLIGVFRNYSGKFLHYIFL